MSFFSSLVSNTADWVSDWMEPDVEELSDTPSRDDVDGEYEDIDDLELEEAPEEETEEECQSRGVRNRRKKKSSGTPVPSQNELDNLSEATSRLWKLDTNRARFGRDLRVNVGGATNSRSWSDAAREPLFEYVNEEIFNRRNFRAFTSLLDNYTSVVGTRETETSQERGETNAFLDVMMNSKCMKYCHKYLQAKGKAPSDVGEFKQQLYKAWFDFYRRGTWDDSCGFEHVFVGEIKNGAITGFHNWVQFYLQEKEGKVDYRGFIYSRRRGKKQSEMEDESPDLVTVKFAWDDDGAEVDEDDPVKPLSSMFIGCSPEFEFALYSMLFFLGETNNKVRIGEYYANIKCYHMDERRNNWVGSSFPEALSWDDPEDPYD